MPNACQHHLLNNHLHAAPTSSLLRVSHSRPVTVQQSTRYGRSQGRSQPPALRLAGSSRCSSTRLPPVCACAACVCVACACVACVFGCVAPGLSCQQHYWRRHVIFNAAGISVEPAKGKGGLSNVCCVVYKWLDRACGQRLASCMELQCMNSACLHGSHACHICCELHRLTKCILFTQLLRCKCCTWVVASDKRHCCVDSWLQG